MRKTTEDILIAFSLHEGLDFRKVKKIFQSQPYLLKQIQLRDMKKTIEQNPPKTTLFPIKADSEAKSPENDPTESSTNGGNKKDE